jgi:Protein of unknown function (DUF3305)
MQQSFPVSILLDYVPTPDNRWQAGRWAVTGVVAAEPKAEKNRVQSAPLHPGSNNRQVLWSGFSVDLFKDDAESYYYNIVSDTPRIFVICNIEDDASLKPLMVTMSYDEAASYMESDEAVESVAMPVELYRFVEQFVLENYLPEKKKKRKRDNWKEGDSERPPGH